MRHRRTAEEHWQGERLDKAWSEALGSECSRSSIAQWIKQGRALVNARVCRRPSYRIQAGDRLELESEDRLEQAEAMDGPARVIHEDAQVLVVNKQPGLSVHPAPSEEGPTLIQHLLARYPDLAGLDPVRPGIVQRLDKDTTGLLVVARSEEAGASLAQQLAERRVFKEYLALVRGRPERDEEEIRLPLGRDPAARHKMAVLEKDGREAVSRCRLLETFQDGAFSLLAVRILTGRTHQIRVHLAAKGLPVLGDALYGPAAWAELKRSWPRVARLVPRQMLHAWRLEFEHPATAERQGFRQPVPKDMLRVLLALFRRMQRVGVTGMPGSGKSALTERLSGPGVPCWSADRAVAELYEPGSDGWEMLRRTFGQEILSEPDGPVDKQALFRRMQESESFRRELLGIVHPIVKHALERFWQAHEGSRMTVAEVPLLVEAGWAESGRFDVVIGVWCPREIRLQRLKANRGWTRETLETLEAWQLPEEDKHSRVDILARNAGTLEALEAEAREVRQALRARRLRAVKGFLDRLVRSGVR